MINVLLSYRIFITICFFGGVGILFAGWLLSSPLVILFGVGLLGAAVISPLLGQPGSYSILSAKRLNWRVPTLAYLVAASILVYLFSFYGFRSLPVLVAICSLYIISIVSLWYSNVRFGVVLFLTSAIAHRGTMFFSNTIAYGSDPLFHTRIALRTAEVGEVISSLEAGKYSITPAYHVIIAILSNISGLPALDSTFLITIMIVLVPSILIYVLACRWISIDAAVLAVVLFVGSEYVIRWSIEPQPTSFGLILFALGVFTFLIWLDTENIIYEILTLVFVVALAYTHQVSAFILLTVLSTILLLSHNLSSVNLSFSSVRPVLSHYLIVGAIWSLGDYGPYGDSRSFVQGLALNFARRSQAENSGREVISPPPELDAVLSGATNLPPMHVSGFSIFLFFAVLGGLYIQRFELKNLHQLETLLPTVGIMFLISFGTGFFITLLQPTRWFVFIYFLLAILGGVGLVVLLSQLPENSVKISGISICILYLILMGGSVPAGPDGVVHQDTNHINDERLTPSEQALLRFSHEHGENADIMADGRAQTILIRHFEGQASTYVWAQDGLQTSGGPHILVERPHLYSGHASFRYTSGRGVLSVSGTPPTSLENCADTVIYSVGGEKVDRSQLRYTERACG